MKYKYSPSKKGRNQADEEYVKSEEVFHSLYENTAIGLYRATPDGRILLANPALVSLLGYESFDELSQRCLENEGFKPEYEHSEFKERIEKDGKVIGFESAWIKKDGSTIYIRENARAIRNDKGKTLYYEGTVEDVTERSKIMIALQLSEERFRSIVEHSHSGIIIVDENYKFLYVNDEFCKIIDCPRAEIIGRDFRDFLSAKSLNLVVDRFKLRQKGEDVPSKYKFNIKRPSGAIRRVEISSATIRDSQGNINTISQLLDITERKQAAMKLEALDGQLEASNQQLRASELELRESEELYRLVSETARELIIIHDYDGNITYANKFAANLLEVDQKSLVGEDIRRFLPPDQKIKMERRQKKRIDGLKRSTVFESEVVSLSGRKYLVEIDSMIFKNPKKAQLILTIGRDITERKRFEIIQKLLYRIATSVNATRSVGELSRLIQIELGNVIDTKNFFLALYNEANDNISLTYHEDEKDKAGTFPAGKTCTAYVIKSGKPLLANHKKIEELIQSGEIENIGEPSKIWLGVPLKVEDKVIGAMVVQSYTDENAYDEKDLELMEYLSSQIGLSIEHKRSDDKVLESEEKYRLLVENVNDGIVITQNNKFIYLNKQFTEMLGYTYDEMYLKDYRDIYTEESLKFLMERKRRRDRGEYVPSRYENVFKKKDGTEIDIEANVTIINYKGDKSGVAHEINNPLMGMINYAELIRSRIKDDSLVEFSAGIIEEGDRISKIVRNLLSFSRQDKESYSPANVKDIIEASLSLFGAVLRKNQITLKVNVSKELP